jgi:ribose 5-phosphate isomerase A
MADEKKLAGEKACDYIQAGTVIGLGTGSTVYYTIIRLGSLVKKGLQIKVVSTSDQTTRLCRLQQIPLVALTDVNELALTIDGADYVDPALNGIKGGHGALLLEKIVASYSRTNIWVVDSTKLVKDFTNALLPLEVCPVGHKQLLAKLLKNGFDARLRLQAQQPFVTDLGNHIIDLVFTPATNPRTLHLELKQITGIFETGLFLNIADRLIIGRGSETIILDKPVS